MALPQQMRAVVPGKSESGAVPVMETVAAPRPVEGEVLIRVKAAGVNRGDLLQVAGMYPPPAGAPQTLGLEVSGVVVAVGEGVKRWHEGDEVCALVAGGGYAEYCVAHEDSVLPVPAGVSLTDAAALPEAYFTVWTNVMERARLVAGETLLVHGGASGIGTAAIQLFAARGHKVYTTAGSAAKCAACVELGAAGAINYREEDFVTALREETGGAGVDVILDMVGGDYIERNISLLKVEGRLVNIAFQKGAQASLNLMVVMLKRLTITGSTLRARSNAQKCGIARAVEGEVWPLLAQRRIRPVVDSVFALEDSAEAHRRMAASLHTGKILIRP